MKHMIIYDWSEVEAALDNALEDDEWKMTVKPYFFKKGFGVVELEEVDILNGMVDDMQEQLRILKGFIMQNLEKEVRDMKPLEEHIAQARKEAQEAEERDFEAEKARLRRLLEEKEEEERD